LRPNPAAAIPVATAPHRDAAVTRRCLRHRLSRLTIDPKVLILQELPKSVMTERSPLLASIVSVMKMKSR
jgi:hypothetical protein